MTRFTHDFGSTISDLLGRVSGEVHTLLKPVMPTSLTTARTKCAPCAYCFSFRSIPSRRLNACSKRPTERRLAANRALISSAEGTICGPAASIT